MFHFSMLGSFGSDLPQDHRGYVPEEGDSPEDLSFDDGRFTEDFDNYGNGYEGYAAEAWSTFVADAVTATAMALEAIEEWNRTQAPQYPPIPGPRFFSFT